MSVRHYPARPVVAVGIVVWWQGRILLIQRGREPRLGEWSIPGGAQKLGETLHQAALRELHEETGLTVPDGTALHLVDALDSIIRDSRGRIEYHYTLVDYTLCIADGASAVAGGDVAALQWADPDALEAFSLWAETRRIIAAARRIMAGGEGAFQSSKRPPRP